MATGRSGSAIDILPGEVLHNVFLNLSVSDRLTASLVCKKWFEILNCKSLLKDITVLIDNNNNVPVFRSASRNFFNFRFKVVVIDNKYYELFKRFSSYIEYISFEKCEIQRFESLFSEDFRYDNLKVQRYEKLPFGELRYDNLNLNVQQYEILPFKDLRYDNLKVLRSIDCDLWTLFPSLPSLKELYLTGNSTINDAGIARLQKSMKHLEVFSLLCFISYDQKVIRRFYPQNMTYETKPSSMVLSFPAVVNFVSERASTLREIHLNYEMPPTALKELTSIPGLCLYKINFNSRNLSVGSLIDLFNSQPKLKAINLTSILKLDENIIDALCSLLSNIEEISLRLCNLTTWSLTKLFRLTKLNKLDISGVLEIPADVFNEAVLNFKAYQLKFLNLSHILYDVENMALDLLFQKCKYLVHLDISNNKIPDRFVHSISKHLLHLEYLCLKCCGITDYGLTGQEKDYEEIYRQNNLSLSNLKSLKELNLDDCHQITDDAILDAIKFRYLRVLHVNGCKLMTSTIQKLLEQNPSIIKINWNGGDRVVTIGDFRS